MKNQDPTRVLYDAVANYYEYNPDTLMPLMMAALASKGKLHVTTEPNDILFCSLTPQEIIDYNWVKYDPVLLKRTKKAITDGIQQIGITGELDESLLEMYRVIHEYDTVTVEQEYHHRLGILYHHSSNEANEQAHRQYATFCLAETLINVEPDLLEWHFLSLGNKILTKSGLQPERPRIQAASILCHLLDYDNEGIVYNPFAGCAFVGAMLEANEQLYADADKNDKLFTAAKLLVYGTGGTYEHIHQHDSTQWIQGPDPDYVATTYMGYINGKSAFDFCLGKCLNTLKPGGKYAAMVNPKEVFEKQTDEMLEAINRDWLDTIVLNPCGEAAVLINTHKEERRKGNVLIYNMHHPLLRGLGISEVLSNELYAETITIKQAARKGFLKKMFAFEIKEREDSEIVRLGDYLSKLTPRTYNISKANEEDRVLAYIDRDVPYSDAQHYMHGIEKRPVTSLFAPAYKLEEDCLITNCQGMLEPRLFDADNGSAYFQEGYAFKFNGIEFPETFWLVEELNKPYVTRQLHPYGINPMLPEAITEKQILDLKIYKPIEEEDEDIGDFDDDNEEDDDKLQEGYVLTHDNMEYTIHRFLSNGYFGYTYTALSNNLTTGEQKEVVLKEFFPERAFKRDGVKAVPRQMHFIDAIAVDREKFEEEGKIMQKLGQIPDSHIAPVFDLFESEETETLYYVMPYYADGSLDDLRDSNYRFTEEIMIKRLILPLCKALYYAHKENVLHLDIKPDNIMLDSDGNAVLIDFGVAKEYDNEGSVINAEGKHSTSPFAAPELKYGNMVKFGPQADIFGLAASIYCLFRTPNPPRAIYEFSDTEEELRRELEGEHCSAPFIDAIIAALQSSAEKRPANIQKFLKMFPGCENIKLK